MMQWGGINQWREHILTIVPSARWDEVSKDTSCGVLFSDGTLFSSADSKGLLVWFVVPSLMAEGSLLADSESTLSLEFIVIPTLCTLVGVPEWLLVLTASFLHTMK